MRHGNPPAFSRSSARISRLDLFQGSAVQTTGCHPSGEIRIPCRDTVHGTGALGQLHSKYSLVFNWWAMPPGMHVGKEGLERVLEVIDVLFKVFRNEFSGPV